MRKDTRTKIKIKEILLDNNNWEHFKIDVLPTKVPQDMLSDVIEAVEKMLGCGDPRNGYTLYKCVDCGEEHIVGFSCKSRFCPSCGKRYVDNWVEGQVNKILEVSHRHLVFTVPEQLRGKIYWNRDLIKEMSDKVAELIQRYFDEHAKFREYKVGVITVVHTFGRDLGFNPHVHALVAEGALDKFKQWKKMGYISYKYLRKAWQKVLLDIFRDHYPEDKDMQILITNLYSKYKNGFYVNAESRMTSARHAARYIGRYLARPSIAEYRILEYDGESVRFWYEDHKTKKRKEITLPVMQFIGRLIMHIPKKHFKMTRRYGLYRRGFNKRAQKIVSLWKYMKKRQLNLIIFKKKKRAMRWRERMIKSFGKDPVRCKKCGKEMILWEIWDPKYDFIFHIEHTDEKGRYIKRFEWEEDPRIERRQKAKDTGDPIPFPGGKRRVV